MLTHKRTLAAWNIGARALALHFSTLAYRVLGEAAARFVLMRFWQQL